MMEVKMKKISNPFKRRLTKYEYLIEEITLSGQTNEVVIVDCFCSQKLTEETLKKILPTGKKANIFTKLELVVNHFGRNGWDLIAPPDPEPKTFKSIGEDVTFVLWFKRKI